jgi:hypothetical protein
MENLNYQTAIDCANYLPDREYFQEIVSELFFNYVNDLDSTQYNEFFEKIRLYNIKEYHKILVSDGKKIHTKLNSIKRKITYNEEVYKLFYRLKTHYQDESHLNEINDQIFILEQENIGYKNELKQLSHRLDHIKNSLIKNNI